MADGMWSMDEDGEFHLAPQRCREHGDASPCEDAVRFSAAAAQDVGVRMVCLGDKLSNIRAIQRDFEALGDGLWSRFNQKDPAEHAWYYSAMADALEGDLGGTEAWCEYRQRVDAVFSDYL